MAETTQEELFLTMARALYSTRLHLLRLTEVVRLNIRPNEDGVMLLPEELDAQMREQAFDFLLAVYPVDWHGKLEAHREAWMQVQ